MLELGPYRTATDIAYTDELPQPSEVRPPRSLMERYKPHPEWFLRQGTELDAVHLSDHLARVWIWQEHLANWIEDQGYTVNREALRWFASVHDTQRADDLDDLEHGERAAWWASVHLIDVVDSETLEELMYLCRAHVIHDGDQPQLTLAAMIAKDADALDRARGCDDLDPRYLRLPVSHALIEPARELYFAYLAHEAVDPWDAVMDAAMHRGLLSTG
jgi:hypothetical protein